MTHAVSTLFGGQNLLFHATVFITRCHRFKHRARKIVFSMVCAMYKFHTVRLCVKLRVLFCCSVFCETAASVVLAGDWFHFVLNDGFMHLIQLDWPVSRQFDTDEF